MAQGGRKTERALRRDAQGGGASESLDGQAAGRPTRPDQGAPPPASPSILHVVAEVTVPPARERLHYFVESQELRRLLCLMAGTELLTELCQRLQAREASEV